MAEKIGGVRPRFPQKDQDSNGNQDDVFLEGSNFLGMASANEGAKMPGRNKPNRSMSLMLGGMDKKPRVDVRRTRPSDDAENHPHLQNHTVNGVPASGTSKPALNLLLASWKGQIKLRFGTGPKVLGQTNGKVENAEVNAPAAKPVRFRQLDVTPPVVLRTNMQGTSTYQWPVHTMASHLAGGLSSVAPLSAAVGTPVDHRPEQLSSIVKKIAACLLIKPEGETEFDAKLSWFSAVNSLWFWLVKPGLFNDMIELMGELTKMLDELAQSLPSITEPAAFGSIVLAAYNDHYYRAVIMNASREKPREKAFVFFVDYGNHAEVLWRDMRSIPKDKSSALALGSGLPMMATRCKPKSIHYGYQFYSADDENAVTTMLINAMNGATRFTGTIWNVSQFICQVDVAIHPAYGLDALLHQRGQIPFDKSSFSTRAGKHMVLLEPKKVRIVRLMSASEMYCWPENTNMTKYAIDGIGKELLRHYGPDRKLEVTLPVAGDAVSVKMDEDRVVRGRVLENPGYDVLCSVELVDYGQTAKVTYDSLHPLHSDDLEIPPLALLCRIKQLQPYDGLNGVYELAADILKIGDKLEHMVEFLSLDPPREDQGMEEWAEIKIRLTNSNGQEQDYADVLKEQLRGAGIIKDG